MKRICICIFTVLFAGTFSAQAQTEERAKLSISAEVGKGFLVGKSNLSTFGATERGHYDGGISANVKAHYPINRHFFVGAKFNHFQSSADYSPQQEASTYINDDVKTLYIGPMVGVQYRFATHWKLEYAIGAGYIHFKSESYIDDLERKCTKGFLGSSFDLSLSRELYKGLHLGVSASAIGGKASSFTLKMEGAEEKVELDKRDKIKMIRIDALLSLKYEF